MRVIIKEPGKPARYADIENTLNGLQEAVGGHIETAYIPGLDGLVLVIDEEGKLKCLPYNFRLPWDDVIVGTALVAGTYGDEFTDCPINLELWGMILEAWGNGGENADTVSTL